MLRPHRRHPLWMAFVIHRISGLTLALFLPAHFYVLGLAISKPADLDGFLQWTDDPIIKFAEFGLVFLLGLHLFGGLRLMALEFFPWSPRQKTYAAMAIAGSLVFSISFYLSAV